MGVIGLTPDYKEGFPRAALPPAVALRIPLGVRPHGVSCRGVSHGIGLSVRASVAIITVGKSHHRGAPHWNLVEHLPITKTKNIVRQENCIVQQLGTSM